MVREYADHLKRYVILQMIPRLGQLDIREINEPIIKYFYLWLVTEHELSKKHIQNIMDAFKKLMKDAYEEKVIFEFPRFPKYRQKKTRRKIARLTEENQDAVIENTPKAHQPIVTFILY